MVLPQSGKPQASNRSTSSVIIYHLEILSGTQPFPFCCTAGPIRSPARSWRDTRTSGGRPRPARMCKRKPQGGGGGAGPNRSGGGRGYGHHAPSDNGFFRGAAGNPVGVRAPPSRRGMCVCRAPRSNRISIPIMTAAGPAVLMRSSARRSTRPRPLPPRTPGP